MPDTTAIPLTDQVTCVRRELAMRRKAYPRWVDQKRMTQADADMEIVRMEAVLATLLGLRDSAGEDTSKTVAGLAARGLAEPASLTPDEVRSVCASALTQRDPGR